MTKKGVGGWGSRRREAKKGRKGGGVRGAAAADLAKGKKASRVGTVLPSKPALERVASKDDFTYGAPGAVGTL